MYSNFLLIHLIRFIHYFIFFFVLIGWLFNNKIILISHLVFIPIMLLHWKLNNNTCFLTNLENSLKDKNSKEEKTEGVFVKSILSICFNTVPSDEKLRLLIYLTISLAWIVSLVKLVVNNYI